MQFMMLMIPNVYRGNRKLEGFTPALKDMEAMGRFNEEMGKAVKILSLNGLHPLYTGARVSFGKGKPTVTDGPFVETKEVLGGYWLVEASSKEELVKWAQRCPAAEGDMIEIRQVLRPGGLCRQIAGYLYYAIGRRFAVFLASRTNWVICFGVNHVMRPASGAKWTARSVARVSLTSSLLGFAAFAAPALHAQENTGSSDWQFSATIYGWLPDVGGKASSPWAAVAPSMST